MQKMLSRLSPGDESLFYAHFAVGLRGVWRDMEKPRWSQCW